MKTTRAILLIICGALLGAATGMALRARHHALEVESAALRRFVLPTRHQPAQAGDLAWNTSSLTNDLAQNVSLSTGVTRWLYWMEAVERASLADFPRLARLASGNRQALRLVAARWAQLDSKNFFRVLLQKNTGLPVDQLAYRLILDWAKRDPSALVAAMTEAGSPASQWRRTAANSIIKENPELGLQLISQWNIPSFAPSTSGVHNWAAADPRHAAEFVLQTRVGSSSSEGVMQAVGEEWGKSDPAAAIEFAAHRQGKLPTILASAAVDNWAKRDLSGTTQWLETADPALRNRLAAPVVEEWAKSDPAAALTWAEANLGGTSLNAAAAAVLKGAAEKDVSSAARLVDVMQPSSARSAAAVEVAQRWLPRIHNSADGPVEASDDAINWLHRLDPDSVKAVLEGTSFQWSGRDPEGLAAFLSSAAIPSLNPSVYESTARELARSEPLHALEWAEQLPSDAATRAGSHAFAEWARSQPAEAADWFNQLAPNDSRRSEFLKMVVMYVGFEPNGAERLGAMPIDDREAFRVAIDKMGFPAEKRTQMLNAIGFTQSR